MKIQTVSEFLFDSLDDPDYCRAIRGLVTRATSRGDRTLVYRCVDLGHPELGMAKVTTYGSAHSMLMKSDFPTPPDRLPDIGGDINWRYALDAELIL